MALESGTYSRFLSTPTIIQNGEEVWGTWRPPSFLVNSLPARQQTAVRVGSDVEGRPDLISLDLYGTTQLDWLIIAFNRANGVFNWPRAGTVIIAPIPGIVLGEVL